MRLRLSLLILVLISGCVSQPEPAQLPNVLFIAVDDLRPELGSYGYQRVHSPNIDRLAAEGILFERAYVQQAVCNPSRASLMTGLRPDALRVWDLQTDFRTHRPDAVTIAEHFKQNGYHSVAIGKIFHNVIPDSQSWSEDKLHIDGYPFDPDAVYVSEEQVAIQEARKANIIAAGRQERSIDQLGQWYLKAGATEAPDVPDNAYYDGAMTDVALDKLSELKDRNQPFFFGIGYYRPHLPFNAPKKYWDLYDPDQIPPAENPYLPDGAPIMAINNMRELRGYSDFRDVKHPQDGILSEADARRLKHGYYASVSYVDAQVGRLLDRLDELGLRENTIVILWGDHGWKLGEHASWGKMTNFEIDTRAPLIIRAPNQVQKGIRTDRLVEFVDIYPTLCDLAGLPAPEDLEGDSMVPLFEDPDRSWKPAVFSQFLREGIWIAPDGIEYMGYSIRTDRYRYTKWHNWESGSYVANELYDHSTDPMENRNLAVLPEFRSLSDSLSALLESGWQAARPIP